MKAFVCVALLASWLSSSAQAQTFGLDGSAAKGNEPKVQQRVSAPLQKQTPAVQKKDEAEDKAAKEREEQNRFMEDSVANFSKEDNSKKYDNSHGRVIRFKVVDGEIQFLEDKDRKILIYYDNYKVSRGMDNVVRCTLRLYVLNDLEKKISNLGFKLHWPEMSTSLQMKNIEQGVSRYTDVMLLGNGCFTMDKTPTVEVNRCRIKGLSEEQCADKVKWFARSRK